MRFDFIRKKEFHLKKGNIGQFSYFENHPLLIDYNENIVETFINSKPEHIDVFISDFKKSIEAITEGWRSWTSYVENKDSNLTIETFLSNVNNGTGKILEAPFTINQKVVAVCDLHNVSTVTFGKELERNNFSLIFIGDNYVIAKDFRRHYEK